jgi:formylmethanofuran dehydrogenase subunit C
MSLRLRLRAGTASLDLALVDGAALAPDRLAALAPVEAARLPVAGDATRARTDGVPAPASAAGPSLGDLFDIDAGRDATPDTVALEGELAAVTRLGAGMSRGRLVVRGAVGARAGSAMSGGWLAIEGDAGERAGEGMTGGVLVIDGAAGDRLGSPLAGASRGVDGGAIVVRGGAGALAGFRMRRGTIYVGGAAGPGAGAAMIAGTLVLGHPPGPGAGALMRRGTIAVLGPFTPGAAFAAAGRAEAPHLKPWWDALARAGVALPEGLARARFARFSGDMAEGGRGEMLILEGDP